MRPDKLPFGDKRRCLLYKRQPPNIVDSCDRAEEKAMLPDSFACTRHTEIVSISLLARAFLPGESMFSWAFPGCLMRWVL